MRQHNTGSTTSSRSSSPTTPSHRPKRLCAWLIFACIIFATTHCQRQTPPIEPAAYGSNSYPIINGTADLMHPAIGAIVYQGTSFCTGTLITQQLVLTAAHCIAAAHQRGIQQVKFRIDFPDGQMTYRSELYQLQALHSHPLYQGGNKGYEYDLGLLVLTQKVTTTSPLPLLRLPMEPAWRGQTARIVGYGLVQTQPTVKRADRKYSADIPIIQIDPRSFIHQDMATNRSACHGDSGGPALFSVNGLLHIIGVTSVAYKATPSSQPGLTLCDGGAISTRVDVHITSFLQRYLTQYADGPRACAGDQECTPCETCQGQLCEPTYVAKEPRHCQPCRSDQECGNGRCHRFPEGYRCLMPCTGTNDQCCPRNHYCSSSFATGITQALCIPNGHSCPIASCQQDADCGLGEICKDDVCTPQLPPTNPQVCRPCYSSTQCGQGGHCYDSSSSQGYCVQPCSTGQFCPTGFTCRQLAPSLSMCIPTKECPIKCSTDTECPQSYLCQSGQCTRKGGGQDGDFCLDTSSCSTGYQCLPTDEGQPMRCAKRCDAPAGAAGSPCTNGLCQPGLKCFQLNGATKVCLEPCNGTCAGGGQCYELSPSISVCLCQDHTDCQTNQLCNTNALRELGVGACTPKATRPPCRPGLTCDPNPPDGHLCHPIEGDQRVGQRCSFMQRCAKDLTCHQLTTLTPQVCLETCSAQQPCQRGGQCITTQQGQSYCLCTSSTDCSPGTICHIVVSSTHSGDIGYCKRTESFLCRDRRDCPAEYKCKDGKCISDPNATNEPFPTEHPQPEPQPEPTPEPISEPTNTTDGNTNEIEPTPEPNGPEPPEATQPKEKQNHDNAVRERDDTSTQPTPDNPDKTPPTGPNCGCQSTSKHPFPMSLLLLLLLALPAWQRKGHPTPKQ